MVAAFFHLYAAGAWEGPTSEYLRALDAADFDGPLYVGIVGDAEQQRRARAAIGREFTLAASCDAGTEELTLRALWEWARKHPTDVVVYSHTKGTGHAAPHQGPWFHAMLRWVVGGWRHHAAALLADCEIVGSRGWDAEANRWLLVGDFDGGVWIARADWIADGPPPPETWPYGNDWHYWPLRADIRFKDSDGTVYLTSGRNDHFFEIGHPIGGSL